MARFEIGLRALQVGLRRQQLLVELRRFDLRHQLSSTHMGSNVEVPPLQVAARPRVDRRVRKGLRIARKRDLRRQSRGDRMDNMHRWNRRLDRLTVPAFPRPRYASECPRRQRRAQSARSRPMPIHVPRLSPRSSESGSGGVVENPPEGELISAFIPASWFDVAS